MHVSNAKINCHSSRRVYAIESYSNWIYGSALLFHTLCCSIVSLCIMFDFSFKLLTIVIFVRVIDNVIIVSELQVYLWQQWPTEITHNNRWMFLVEGAGGGSSYFIWFFIDLIFAQFEIACMQTFFGCCFVPYLFQSKSPFFLCMLKFFAAFVINHRFFVVVFQTTTREKN